MRIKMTSPMFEFSKVYKPFKYPWAMELAVTSEKIHWIEDEVTLEEDINDWKRGKLSEYEKEFITQVLRLFTQSDLAVGTYYYDKFIPLFKNNEIRNMLGSFAAREGIHQRAYALLNDSLGLPEGEYSAFLEYDDMRKKMEYMTEAPVNPTLPQIGTTLAKSVFNEGVSLFASFAMLLNFQRRGLMRGCGKIVEWSIRDESCFTGDTEILTDIGWQRFDALSTQNKIAQYDSDYGTISWTIPNKYIEKHFEGSLVNIRRDKVSLDVTCTEDHDLLIQDTTMKYNMPRKVKAIDFEPAYKYKFYCAGESSVQGHELSAYEKFLIAYNFVPTLDYKLDEIAGSEHRYVKFLVEDAPKVLYMRSLLSEVGYEYTEDAKRISSNFIVKIPATVPKDLEWVKVNTLSASWCEAFIRELYFWKDGGTVDDGEKVQLVCHSLATSDLIQIICVLGGFKCHTAKRKLGLRTSYSFVISRNKTISTSGAEKTLIPYGGMVYCVSVPTGNIIIRQNGRVLIIGNCHVDGISKLFKAFVGEHKEVVTDPFKKAIYEMAKMTVANEDKFIDLAYKDGVIEGLPKDDVKQYIRHLTDRRLIQLGLKGIFKAKVNTLPWVEYILNAPDHTNFFEGRVTGYEISGLNGKWDY